MKPRIWFQIVARFRLLTESSGSPPVRMDIDKEDEAIDLQFSTCRLWRFTIDSMIRDTNGIDNVRLFRRITDVYLCKHNIPYASESTGSCVRYRCPFTKSCSFCIKGGISRSKLSGKKGVAWCIALSVGILSLQSICLNHSCNWETVFRLFR